MKIEQRPALAVVAGHNFAEEDFVIAAGENVLHFAIDPGELFSEDR